MTKKQADEMLNKKLDELNSKAETAKDNEEFVMLVDGMLKVYTILCEADGFDKEKPIERAANLGS